MDSFEELRQRSGITFEELKKYAEDSPASAPNLEKRYFTDPVGFCTDVLGLKLWAKQVEILEALSRGPRAATPPTHTVSAARSAGAVALWWLGSRPHLACREMPSERAMRSRLWRHIESLQDGPRAVTATRGSAVEGGFLPLADFLSVVSNQPYPLIVEDAIGGTDGNLPSLKLHPTSRHFKTGDGGQVAESGWVAVQVAECDDIDLPPFSHSLPYLTDLSWVEAKRDAYEDHAEVWFTKILGELPTLESTDV